VGVQELGVRPPRGTHEAREQRRREQREPGSPAQVADEAVPVRQAEAVELLRPDHLDVDPAATYVLDGVRHEAPDGVARVARIRARQDGDTHQLWMRNTA